MQLVDGNGYLYIDERATRPGVQLTLEGQRGASASVMLEPSEVEVLILTLAETAGLDVSIKDAP